MRVEPGHHPVHPPPDRPRIPACEVAGHQSVHRACRFVRQARGRLGDLRGLVLVDGPRLHRGQGVRQARHQCDRQVEPAPRMVLTDRQQQGQLGRRLPHSRTPPVPGRDLPELLRFDPGTLLTQLPHTNQRPLVRINLSTFDHVFDSTEYRLVTQSPKRVRRRSNGSARPFIGPPARATTGPARTRRSPLDGRRGASEAESAGRPRTRVWRRHRSGSQEVRREDDLK